MGLVGRHAADKGVKGLYSMDEAVQAQKFQRPIDRWRRRASPFPLQFLKDIIGATRLMTAPHQLQHTTPQRGQPHPLPFAQCRRRIKRRLDAMPMIMGFAGKRMILCR